MNMEKDGQLPAFLSNTKVPENVWKTPLDRILVLEIDEDVWLRLMGAECNLNLVFSLPSPGAWLVTINVTMDGRPKKYEEFPEFNVPNGFYFADLWVLVNQVGLDDRMFKLPDQFGELDVRAWL